MHILMIGDIVGEAGRRLVKNRLADLKRQYEIDFCVANAENTAAGFGLSERLANELHETGVDVITLGNHTFAREDLLRSIDRLPHVIRPANVPRAWPGRGYLVQPAGGCRILVLNLLGRIYMEPADSPFETANRVWQEVTTTSEPHQGGLIFIVDFHAEATSEKKVMGYYLDGRATLVAGTHTHVQTADECVLAGGTAYITDVGMTGPDQGVLGMNAASSMRRLVDCLPSRYELAEGDVRLCAVVVDADEKTGLARSIERINIGAQA